MLLRGANVNALGEYVQADPAAEPTAPVTDEDWDAMAAHGFSVLRLIMSWSRLEPERGEIDRSYIRKVSRAVQAAKDRGIYVLRERRGIADQLTKVWVTLAAEFAVVPGVAGHDLLNEPNRVEPTEPNQVAYCQWVQRTIDAVRAAEQKAGTAEPEPVFAEPLQLYPLCDRSGTSSGRRSVVAVVPDVFTLGRPAATDEEPPVERFERAEPSGPSENPEGRARADSRGDGVERRCGVLRTAWRGAVASVSVSTRSGSRWWAWVLALTLLIGAVLLMHGLAVVAGEHHGATSTAVMSGVGSHAADDLNGHLQATSSSEDGNCLECVVGHVMAACMAVLTVIAGVGLLRYRLFAGRVTVFAAVCDWTGTLVESARSPDPPWVRLSVMRC